MTLPLLQELHLIVLEYDVDTSDLLEVYQEAYCEHKRMTGSLAHLLYENAVLYDQKMHERHLYNMNKVVEYARGLER